MARFAAGFMPGVRHDGSRWKPSDGLWYVRSGDQLPIKGIICQIRSDWMENCSTFGFPTWSSLLFPCLQCTATQDDWFDPPHTLTPSAFPWALHDAALYEQYVAGCEHWVQLTGTMVAEIKPHLSWDAAARGRALMKDFLHYNLLAGDRLEPSESLRDAALSDDLTFPYPLVCFWRRAAETRSRHRNPLFCAELGISHLYLMNDSLHCMYLGFSPDLLGTVVWHLMACDVWFQRREGRSNDERINRSILLLFGDIVEYYRDVSARDPSKNLTRANCITREMLGSAARPALSLKGMETKCLLPFGVLMLEKYMVYLGDVGSALKAACDAMTEMLTIFPPVDVGVTILPLWNGCMTWHGGTCALRKWGMSPPNQHDINSFI